MDTPGIYESTMKRILNASSHSKKLARGLNDYVENESMRNEIVALVLAGDMDVYDLTGYFGLRLSTSKDTLESLPEEHERTAGAEYTQIRIRRYEEMIVLLEGFREKETAQLSGKTR